VYELIRFDFCRSNIKIKVLKVLKTQTWIEMFWRVQLNLIDEVQNCEVKTYNVCDGENVKIYSRPMLYCAI